MLASIRAAIPDLAPKPGASWRPEDGVVICGSPEAATLEAFDAPGKGNVAWLSSLHVPGRLSSLTVLNGPLTDVPHLVTRCVLKPDAGTLSVFVDWRPRAYGAYEMQQPDGSYPGPDVLGRDSFTFSGARDTMGKRFFTEDLAALVDGAKGAFIEEGGGSAGAPVSEEDQLTRGPLCLHVADLPLTEASVARYAAFQKEAIGAWLGWQAEGDDHAHRPGAPVNSQYVFDTPAKQQMYGALLASLTGLYGAQDAAKVAAADSGPLDEAYVGGAS